MSNIYNYESPLKPLVRLITLLVNIASAMVSFYFNKSFLWAIFHFIFGWVYMIYCVLLGRFADGKLVEILTSYF